ncbi:hypothetical protein V6N13_073024 [Hibiscus sabdariffa]
MEIHGFWSIDKREEIAQALLKNVDLKNEFHCGMKFNSADELAQHMPTCKYGPRTSQNEGCQARFSASQVEKHDSVCPFKTLPCEQKCSASLMRREMDRHCIIDEACELPFLFTTIFSSIQKYSTKLANIRDVRSLTYKVKDLHAKVGPLKVGATNKVDEATMTIAKVEFLEANDTNKFTEKGAGAKAIGFETKDQSLEDRSYPYN